MVDGVRIDELDPTATPDVDYVIPAMRDGITYQLSVAQIAAIAYAIIADSAPGTLDTLNELAAALGDDPNFAATTAAALALRVRVDAAQAFNAGQIEQGKANIGLNTVALTSPDLNVVRGIGTYYCSSPTNQPAGEGNGWLIIKPLDANNETQEYRTLTGKRFYRTKAAGVMGKWSVTSGFLASSVAAAATVDLSNVSGNVLHITGTATITGLGTNIPGAFYILMFDAATPLTHGTNLQLPNAASVTMAAGDVAVFVCDNGTIWRLVAWNKVPTSASFRAHKNSVDQSGISNAPVTFGTEEIDVGAIYDPATSRVTPRNGRKMNLRAFVLVGGTLTDGASYSIKLVRNGSVEVAAFQGRASLTGGFSINVSRTVVGNGTDYYEVQVTAGAGTMIATGSPVYTYFEGEECAI